MRRGRAAYAALIGIVVLWLGTSALVVAHSGTNPVPAVRGPSATTVTSATSPTVPRTSTTTTTINAAPWYRALAVRKWNESIAWLDAVHANNVKAWNAAVVRARLARGHDWFRPTAASLSPFVGVPSGCAYADLIRSIWQRDAEWAINIAFRESRCSPGALNRSGSSGLFQILMPLHADLVRNVCGPGGSVFDAACNVRVAWALYQSSGRAPWNL